MKKLTVKICKICKEEKDINNFYRNRRICKECYIKIKLKSAKEYYEKNKSNILTTHKKYYQKTKNKWIEHRKEYLKNNREKINQWAKKYYRKNPKLDIIRSLTKRHFGHLKKECEICSSKENLQFHHPKPYTFDNFEILCRKCHLEKHKKLLEEHNAKVK